MYYPQNLLENANRFLKERKVQLGEVSLYRSAMALGRDLSGNNSNPKDISGDSGDCYIDPTITCI